MTIDSTSEPKAAPINKGWLHYGLSKAGSMAVYVAIGAFAHAYLYRREFDPHDLLSWAWLGAWPVCLLAESMGWILWGFAGVMALLAAVVGGYFLWKLGTRLWWIWVELPQYERRRAEEVRVEGDTKL